MHRFSRRASPLNTKRPRDHRTCPYVVQFHFQDRSRRASSNTSLRSLISAIENARFTCHRSHAPIPHADSSAGVLYSARRVAWASTGCSSTRPRPRRQVSTTSAPKTRAARHDGPLAESSPRPRGASRRRFPTSPSGAAAERARVTERVARVYQQRQAVLRLCLDDVARHSCPPGPRRSAVPAPAAGRVAAEALREGGAVLTTRRIDADRPACICRVLARIGINEMLRR